MQKSNESSMLANPTYLAGKLAYWEGVPRSAINHCAEHVKAAWHAGWDEARADYMHLQASANWKRGNISSEYRPAVV